MQVCAPVTFPINIAQHLTSCCYFFPAKDPLYHNTVVLPQFAVRTVFNPIFLTISTDIRSCIILFSRAVSPLSHPSFFQLCVLQCSGIHRHSLEHGDVPTLGPFLPKKVLGPMRVISPYFQHFNLLKEHDRFSAKAQDPPGAHGCCWQRVLGGISISKYSWCFLAIANLQPCWA